MAISGNPTLLSHSLRWGDNDTLITFPNALTKSRILSAQTEDLDSIYPGSEVEFNWHKYGVYLIDYFKYPALSRFFDILSYDVYPDAEPIGGTVEAYNYPIYATQYHPEKNLYDFLNPRIPHSRRAQQFTEDLAFFFVKECRKNHHHFNSYRDEMSMNMNNYPKYVGVMGHAGTDIYIEYYIFNDVLHT